MKRDPNAWIVFISIGRTRAPARLRNRRSRGRKRQWEREEAVDRELLETQRPLGEVSCAANRTFRFPLDACGIKAEVPLGASLSLDSAALGRQRLHPLAAHSLVAACLSHCPQGAAPWGARVAPLLPDFLLLGIVAIFLNYSTFAFIVVTVRVSHLRFAFHLKLTEFYI